MVVIYRHVTTVHLRVVITSLSTPGEALGLIPSGSHGRGHLITGVSSKPEVISLLGRDKKKLAAVLKLTKVETLADLVFVGLVYL